MHLTDNKDVVAVFTKGSHKKKLQSMAVKIYKAVNLLNLKLYCVWRSRDDPIMQLVVKGSSGPWLDFDDFSLDANTVREVKSREFNIDRFASFHNRVRQK